MLMRECRHYRSASKEKADLYVRRITEAEAASEAALAALRRGLQGPRLIIPGM